MSRTSAGAKVVLAAVVMALPSALAAQTFKIEKYNIGGEGGTDSSQLRSGVRSRLHFARHARN